MAFMLAVYVLVGVFFLYVILVGPMHRRGGPMGKLYSCVVATPNVVGALLCIVLFCGRTRGLLRWHAISDYLQNKPNPILVIFYLSLTVCAIAVYFWTCIPLFEAGTAVFSVLVCFVGLGTFFVVWKSNPGVIRSKDGYDPHSTVEPLKWLTPEQERLQNARYAHDNTFYTPNAECWSCGVVRPARSKHCRICGHCVRRFDHHCAWISGDVGENNHRLFLLFLLAQWTMCWWATATTTMALKAEADRERMWEGKFVDSKGGLHAATTWMVLQYIGYHLHPFPSVLIFFTLLVGLLMFGFFLYHLRLVLRNTTTNEVNKISDIVDYIENYESYQQFMQDLKAKEAATAAAQEGKVGGKPCDANSVQAAPTETKGKDVKSSEVPSFDELVDRPTFLPQGTTIHDVLHSPPGQGCSLPVSRKDVVRRLRRTYDRGWYANLVEVLYPYEALNKAAAPRGSKKKTN